MITFFSFARFLGGLSIALIVAMSLYGYTNIFDGFEESQYKYIVIVVVGIVAFITRLEDKPDNRIHKSGKLTSLFKKKLDEPINKSSNGTLNYKDNTKFYLQAKEEVGNKTYEMKLWYKANALTCAEEEKAKNKYIELRISQLIEEADMGKKLVS